MIKKEYTYYLLLGVGILIAILLMVADRDEGVAKEAQVMTDAYDAVLAEEKRVCYLLDSLDSVDEVSVMIRFNDDSQISGIAVICSNGESSYVQEKIIRLLRALYGIGSHQISVSG